MQRWKPDTCKCIILEDVINGVVTYNSHEFVCPEHVGLTEQKLATVPLEHNRRKNRVDGLLKENLTALLTTTDADGNIVYKNGITFNWSFSGVGESRVLNISISGVNLSTAQKNNIQSKADTLLGAGKVVVV